MPIQLAMPSFYNQKRFSTIPEEDEEEDMLRVSAQEKSGDLVMVGPDSSQRHVQLEVYRTSLEHFAVVYPQKKICRPIGVLNLRNTSCHPLNFGARSGILLRQNGLDRATSVTFLCESPRDVPGWTTALSSSPASFLRQSSLPAVEEDDEY